MKIQLLEDLSLSNIHKLKSQEEIFKKIIPQFSRIETPFSIRDEGYPSASVIKGVRGDLIFRDFGDIGQDKAETWWKYLQRTQGFGNSLDGYLKSLQYVKDLFKLPLRDYTLLQENTKLDNYSDKISVLYKEKSINSTKIEVKRRPFTSNDLEYWNQFGVPKWKLEEKKIASLDCFWITNYRKDGIRKKYKIYKDSLCFVYPYYRDKEGFYMYKIYQPLRKRMKWISNVTKRVVQNYPHIPKKGELLFIQSSLKDILCMEMLGDYCAIAPNGEGHWFTGEYWSKLQTRWKKIVLFANNDWNKEDNPGLGYARKHSIKYRVPFICTPNNTSSDISDYYKKFGEFETRKLMDKLLNYIELL